MSYRTNRKTGGIFKATNTGKIENVNIEDEDVSELLARHIYSYRDYRVGEFARAYKRLPGLQIDIRMKYRQMESGRIAQIMDATHKLVASLDSDERVLFKSRNPALWVMMNEWAVVEDLAEF